MKAFATFIILTTLSLNIMAQQKIVQTAGRTQLGEGTEKVKFTFRLKVNDG